MGVFAATLGATTSTPVLMYAVGTTVSPTQPTPLGVAVGAEIRFAEVRLPDTDGLIRLEWLPVLDFSPSIPLPVSLIIGTQPPVSAILQNNTIIEDTASNEPLISEEARRILLKFEEPLGTVFAPPDRVPLDQLFDSSNNEGFLTTVGDAAGAGAGIGAIVGLVKGGPAGAAAGGAVGGALGASFGIGFYLGEQLGKAIS